MDSDDDEIDSDDELEDNEETDFELVKDSDDESKEDHLVYHLTDRENVMDYVKIVHHVNNEGQLIDSYEKRLHEEVLK